MVIFYKKLKKYNEIQLTKKKMDLNNRKMTNHPSSRVEFGRVCERRKLRVNVGKSKVMRRSWYRNGGRMHVILNGEQLRGSGLF